VAQRRLATHSAKARHLGATIAFVDEVGFSFLAATARTWAPKGKTPVLRRVSKRRVISTVVALTTTGKVFKRHFRQAVRGEDVVIALRHFRRHITGPLIIVWDRLSAHRAKCVQQFVADDADLYVEWLPPYAPDLNPEEACHGNVKQHLRNATPATIEELQTQVDRGFARLRQRPDLLQSFFHHAGLRDVTLLI
jgi:transposase